MGEITNNKGEVIGTFEDTLEDWRQAAQVEAKLRREFQAENEQLREHIRLQAADIITLGQMVGRNCPLCQREG